MKFWSGPWRLGPKVGPKSRQVGKLASGQSSNRSSSLAVCWILKSQPAEGWGLTGARRL